MGTTGSRPSATVRYPVSEQNPVWRNAVAATTLAGSVAAGLTEMGSTTGASGALYSATEAPAEVPTGDDSSCVSDQAGRERAGVWRANWRGNVDIGVEEMSASSGNVAEATTLAAF